MNITSNLPYATIIIPVLDEEGFIEQTLRAVLNQDYPLERLEILVIDGGSTDKTRQIVQKLLRDHPNAQLLHNPQRIQASALNIGILAAQGDIIIRVDGHTLIAPDYVSRCVEYLLQGKADNVGGLMRPLGTTYIGQTIALATTSPFGIGNAKFHYSEREQFVDTVYLGAFWRKTFAEIGLYDEAVNINEDYELNYRLRKAGGKILLSPHIKSTYIPRNSLTSLWKQYFNYGRQKVRTLQKHPASLRWRQAVAPLFVGILIGTFLAGLLWSFARWLFLLAFGCYLLANLVASTIAASRGGWQYFPVLPVIFAIIHIAWGVGFWVGLGLALFSKK
jgi:glycosyltransferase involved in cell wall biosynthesis